MKINENKVLTIPVWALSEDYGYFQLVYVHFTLTNPENINYVCRNVPIAVFEFNKLQETHKYSLEDLARAIWNYGEVAAELNQKLYNRQREQERVSEYNKKVGELLERSSVS